MRSQIGLCGTAEAKFVCIGPKYVSLVPTKLLPALNAAPATCHQYLALLRYLHRASFCKKRAVWQTTIALYQLPQSWNNKKVQTLSQWQSETRV